jgi:hypothetical protein
MCSLPLSRSFSTVSNVWLEELYIPNIIIRSVSGFILVVIPHLVFERMRPERRNVVYFYCLTFSFLLLKIERERERGSFPILSSLTFPSQFQMDITFVIQFE